MKINKVFGRELFNSEGMPVLSCEIVLDDGTFVSATVPTDSRMEQEGFSVLTDGGKRCGGQGLYKAVHMIDSIVAPALEAKEPELVIVDALLSELDGTAEKKKLGANVTLAVSMAVCKAQAAAEELELFEMISQIQGSSSVSLPFPLLTLLSGGESSAHMPFTGVMLVPVGAQNFRIAIESTLTVFHAYRSILRNKKRNFSITEVGAIESNYFSVYEPFDFMAQALKETGLEQSFVIGLDAATDGLFDQETGLYTWSGQKKTAQELTDFYKILCDKYPIYSLENGLSWRDIDGGGQLFELLGGSIQLATDIGFMHSATLLQGLGARPVTNAIIIRLTSASTVTELLESVAFCQNHGMNAVISSGTGETEETFIADLSVGTSSGQIQAGGGVHSQNSAKYNRLLCIEDLLAAELLNHM